MNPKGPFEPLVLAGDARARGRAHGEALRPLIHELLGAWGEEIRRAAGLDLRSYLDRFARDCSFLPAARRWTPELLDEIGGIAEGAAVSPTDCLLLQHLDEHWQHLERLSGPKGARPRHKCSTAVLLNEAGRPTHLCQNMDLPKYLDGFQTILRLTSSGSDPELLLSSFAGFVGLFGVNSRGVAVVVNNLSQLAVSTTGLPVSHVLRGALRRPTVAAAVAFISQVPHATGQSYLVGGPDGFVALECSANRVEDLTPGGGTPFLAHTNHPLACRDLRAEEAGWDEDREHADATYGRTFTRLAALERELSEPAAFTVERLKEVLSRKQSFVCRPVGGPFEVFTFASGIVELSAPLPVLHLSAGTPDPSSYRELRFDGSAPPAS